MIHCHNEQRMEDGRVAGSHRFSELVKSEQKERRQEKYTDRKSEKRVKKQERVRKIERDKNHLAAQWS